MTTRPPEAPRLEPPLALAARHSRGTGGLRADSPFPSNAPDLIVVAGYDAAAFTHLMRTGKALGERELPMMSGVARGRFVHFTDEEVGDLYFFLSDLAARAAAAR